MNFKPQKMKLFGKKAIAFLLSFVLISQIMDFSVLSVNAVDEIEYDNSPLSENSQNGQIDNNNSESSNVKNEEVILNDLTVTNGYTVDGDIDVNNLILTGGTLNLNNHTLTVHGNVEVRGGTLYVNKGYLECLGNCSFCDHNSHLTMDNVNDSVFIKGDFLWCRASNSNISNGTIEIQGDFTDNSDWNYFASHNNNKIILSGNQKQNLTFTSANTYFASLEITNTSSEGVTANLPIVAGELIRNGHNISYPVDGRFVGRLTAIKQ